MQWFVIMAGVAVLLAVLALVFAIIGLKTRREGKIKSSVESVAIISPSKDNLLRKLIRSAATSDINEAAFGVINTLLADPHLHFNYVSLLLWMEGRDKMSLLGTNVPQTYGKYLVEHINELHAYASNRRLSACTNHTEGTLSYPSAKERHICFEYYLPLYNGADLIGAIYFESSDRNCHDVVKLDFFALMVDNISLVLSNIALMQQVLRQANVDKLTQLYNRTYMMRYYEQLKTAKAEYSLILMDIDFFKKCNDTYGHNVGDIVLREVAKVLNTSARSYQDGVFRYGGEEFLIILRDAPLNILKTRAEKIRQAVESLVITYEEGKTLQVTLSLGVYSADTTKPLEKNIAYADQALYYSKQHGRNRVTAYADIPPDELALME